MAIHITMRDVTNVQDDVEVVNEEQEQHVEHHLIVTAMIGVSLC